MYLKTLVCLSDGKNLLDEYRFSSDACGRLVQSYVPCEVGKRFMLHFQYDGQYDCPHISQEVHIRCTLTQNGRYVGNLRVPVLDPEAQDPSQPCRSVGTIAGIRTGPTKLKLLKFRAPPVESEKTVENQSEEDEEFERPQPPKFGSLCATISYEYQSENGRMLPIPEISEMEHVFHYASSEMMQAHGIIPGRKRNLSHFNHPDLPTDIWDTIEYAIKDANKAQREEEKKIRDAGMEANSESISGNEF